MNLIAGLVLLITGRVWAESVITYSLELGGNNHDAQ
jgi:hypothetical protein